jgi:adenylate kinase family enzyme
MMNKKVIFFIGTAGSGKSYIAKQLAALVDADYLSSGDIARTLPDAQKDLASGELYHNDTPILNGVFDFITDPRRSDCTIVDGVPRNENQAHWLVNFSNNVECDWLVVYIDAELGTRLRRIVARARDVHDGYDTVIKRLSKDLITMTDVYDTLVNIFGGIRVLKLLSEKDGDTTTEISAIMDRMHKFITSTETNLVENNETKH